VILANPRFQIDVAEQRPRPLVPARIRQSVDDGITAQSRWPETFSTAC
jgi:hypothetical protein